MWVLVRVLVFRFFPCQPLSNVQSWFRFRFSYLVSGFVRTKSIQQKLGIESQGQIRSPKLSTTLKAPWTSLD